jgi:hypothetical protein
MLNNVGSHVIKLNFIMKINVIRKVHKFFEYMKYDATMKCNNVPSCFKFRNPMLILSTHYGKHITHCLELFMHLGRAPICKRYEIEGPILSLVLLI